MTLYKLELGALAVIGLAVLVSVIYLIRSKIWDWQNERRNLEYFKKTYPWKRGGTLMPDGRQINYNLVSVNGGKQWFALGEDRVVIGLAEDVYPGLLEHLEGVDRLVSFVDKNGPISLADPIGVGALVGAGFSVVKTADTGNRPISISETK